MCGKVFRFAASAGTFVLAVALFGCGSPVDAPGSTLPEKCQTTPPKLQAQKTDILFVIDNSDSMREEQAGIARELPAFIDELHQGAGVAQDFQVGVITTSVYQNALSGGQRYYTTYPTQSGRLQAVPVALPDGGEAPGTERVIRGDDPDLLSKFSRLIQQGVTGSGQETPFEAVRLAVTPPLSTTPLADGGNEGFFRDGARLLVVVVSDEDDCSEPDRPPQVYVGTSRTEDYCTEQAAKLGSVQSYFDDFEGLVDSTGAPRQVLWAAIAPVSLTDKTAQAVIDGGQLQNVGCPTSSGPGYRHRQMAALFDPTLSNLTSICSTSYHQSLLNIASLATIDQVVSVMNVPDPRLLVAEITRADGTTQSCTVANGGIAYLPADGGSAAHLKFQGSCLREPGDQKVEVRLLCVG